MMFEKMLNESAFHSTIQAIIATFQRVLMAGYMQTVYAYVINCKEVIHMDVIQVYRIRMRFGQT